MKLSGSYIDRTDRYNLKFSFIKCQNTTENTCESEERINDFLANVIIEMRINDLAVDDEFNTHVNQNPLVNSEDLIQTF